MNPPTLPPEEWQRELLEFFLDRSPSEVGRLAGWFHDIIESGELGLHEYNLKTKAASA